MITLEKIRKRAPKRKIVDCNCSLCGVLFKPTKSVGTKYCSKKCHYEEKRSDPNKTKICEFCNKSFFVRRPSDLGRFCSLTCMGKNNTNEKLNGRSSYFNCCKCHALIGFGVGVSSRLVGKEKTAVASGIRLSSIQRFIPQGGSWRTYASKPNQLSMTWWGGDENAELWMQDYNVEFPTWVRLSSITKLDIWITKYLKDDHAINEHSEKAKIKNRASNRESNRKRKIIDPGFRVKCNLRRRLRDLMKNTKKGGSHHVSSLIGCSTKQLAKHIQSQFSKGMTWRNYGINGWHVDHILPCASFDHNDPRQVAQCWHWTNLRPLWAKDNMMKSDNITQPQMSLMLGGIH